MQINQAKNINGNDIHFNKKYSFYTLVTKYQEYQEMVESAQHVGFIGDDVEFLFFDNKNSNQFDGYSGINHAIRHAQGEYLIFCHQDILFHDHTRIDLDKCLINLEKIDKNWAVVGNAGRDGEGRASIRITDPHGKNQKIGCFPQEVISLDENFIIINRKVNLASSYQMLGFHLYATDLCQNAKHLGLKCYVIDFHLLHKSGGNIDQSYEIAKQQYIALEVKRKQAQFYATSCSNFFVSSSWLLTRLLNIKFFLKKVRSFRKYRKNQMTSIK